MLAASKNTQSCFQPDTHSSGPSTDTNPTNITKSKSQKPAAEEHHNKSPAKFQCINCPDGNFKDKAATTLPVRRTCERFLLDIFSSRRNRLFQLQFVICLLHTPLCVHAFDKSLSECKPTIMLSSSGRNISKTQKCHLQTRTPRVFSCHIVTFTYCFPVSTPRNEFHT